MAKEKGVQRGGKLFLLPLVIFLFVFLPSLVFSLSIEEIFDLSFTLTEGGINRMELNSANWFKGITIQVRKKRSDFNQQYELIQQTLISRKKGTLPEFNFLRNLVVRRITEVAPAGTFHIQSSNTPVSQSSRIYTSDGSGTGVTFTLVYGIERPEELAPGDYSVQINLILRPVGGGATVAQITRIFFIEIRIPEEAKEQTEIEFITLSGLSRIYLNSRKEGKKSFDVQVKFNYPPRAGFTLSQILAEPMRSENGLELDPQRINFVVTQAKRGKATNVLTPLGDNKISLYTTDSGSSTDDSIIITYTFGDLSDVKAGRYHGRILYYLQEIGKPEEFKGGLDIELENERIFDLELSSEQERIIGFYNIKPGETPQTKEVIITIKNNTGHRYQVNQDILQELTDAAGNKIPFEYFTMKLEELDTKGSLLIKQKEPVKKGSTLIYTSDAAGSSDKFKIIYELTVPTNLIAGDYTTQVSYSLVEN